MERKLTCTNYFIILEKRFSREHTKDPNVNVWARPVVTFWAVGYHSPPPHFPENYSRRVCKSKIQKILALHISAAKKYLEDLSYRSSFDVFYKNHILQGPTFLIFRGFLYLLTGSWCLLTF